ncbi:putative mitochondrial protein like [Capsicum annuum]|uniref:uncharacterized mitochondrial protein AtMg01250-like n=1 Tax=Capsicum annuum TaxID=4072 RepID=UPI001FB0B445|nr:uncharacterized mitochondrial protein AtMg01250-like [Capsicum annuum]
MISFEVMLYPKRKTQGKVGYATLKMDMSKAYDRVEWGFPQAMMVKMGFCMEWVNKVMNMVTTVTYQFIHGGKSFGNISPRRGLRQGDLISPYLFLPVTEGFLALLKKISFQGRIHGVKICTKAPSILQLFFTNDALYLFKAATKEAMTIRQCLEIYQAASSQQVDFQMSNIFFTGNTNASV